MTLCKLKICCTVFTYFICYSVANLEFVLEFNMLKVILVLENMSEFHM